MFRLLSPCHLLCEAIAFFFKWHVQDVWGKGEYGRERRFVLRLCHFGRLSRIVSCKLFGVSLLLIELS